MIELCSICGEWKLINGVWDFIVDNERGSSLSMINEDINYTDLIGVVLEDFVIDGSVTLSYVSPSKLNFVSKELPPVFIRNDRQVASYLNKLQENGGLHLCVTIKGGTQRHPDVYGSEKSNLNQTRDKISSTHDSPIAEIFEGGTYTHTETEWNNIQRVNEVSGIQHTRIRDTLISPSIRIVSNKRELNSAGPDVYGSEKSNLNQTRDEISSSHDSPIAGIFEGGTYTHTETEWNNIQRVNEVSGIQHTRIRDTLISPSIRIVSNKRGLHSQGPDVYGSEKSKLSCFSSRRGRESMREDSHSHSEILSPICLANQRDDDDEVFCGMFFKDKKEMSTKLKLLALSQSFEFKTEHSDRKRYILSCVDERCSWRFRAKFVEGSESFVVRQYVSKHTCDTSLRNVSHRQATAKLLGNMVSNHYEGGKIGLRPKQIMEKARNDHGVVISYSKAWRCQEHAQDLARGTPEDSFETLPSWFHMLKEKNPGSVTFIEVDSVGKFKYAFLSFGPSIRGFKLMRKVLSVDGAHLKSKYKGTLLAATAQDGNFHLYPLAFAIVDSENKASWSWFMMCLKTIIPDEEDLVFISDRASYIEAALLQHYPLAHHGICIFHFEKNVLDNHKSSTLIPLVVEAGYAYTKEDFNYYFQEIEKSDTELATYLTKADITKWSRAHSPANRFNIMTSNLAESINSLLKEPREYPIVCLFDTIRMIMTRWFTKRREEGLRHIHPVTVEVGKKMKELYDLKSRWLEVAKINDSEFEVKGDTRIQVVNLEARHCSCLVFDIEKFPCAHAIAAAKAGKKQENDYVDEFFSNERYTLAYSESIYPVGDKAYWNIPSSIASFVCRPPSTRFPSGRRKKKRIPSSWEYGKYPSKSKSTSKSYKCSRCGQQGHNKSSCVEPIG